MIKLLSVAAGIVTALAPAPKELPKPKTPPQVSGGTVIIRVLPGAFREVIDNGQTPDTTYDNNTNGIMPYEVDPQSPEDTQKAADAHYYEMKSKLDEKYEHMFNLKKEIDGLNDQVCAKWEEYNALHRSYERALQKLISNWVTERLYS